jgi:hypothetical protein
MPGGGCICEGRAAEIDEPEASCARHWVQNFAVGLLAVPQLGHARGRSAAHSSQKRAVSMFACPQAGQFNAFAPPAL